jgi:hypothetical protein
MQHKVVHFIDSSPGKDFRCRIDDMLVEEVEVGRKNFGVTAMDSNVVFDRYGSAISYSIYVNKETFQRSQNSTFNLPSFSLKSKLSKPLILALRRIWNEDSVSSLYNLSHLISESDVEQVVRFDPAISVATSKK